MLRSVAIVFVLAGFFFYGGATIALGVFRAHQWGLYLAMSSLAALVVSFVLGVVAGGPKPPTEQHPAPRRAS
jgi:hypothetical protein